MIMTFIIQPKAKWRPIPCPVANCRAYTWGNTSVIVGVEAGKWHLSISCPNRNPTWEEIKQARYDFCPHDVSMAMILPPTDEYVNVHKFCFHLHEIPNEEESFSQGIRSVEVAS